MRTLLSVYRRQGTYLIVVVCLFVFVIATLPKISERICMKFAGNKGLNFGGNPDHGSGSASGYGAGYGDRDTGKACLGGSMNCP